MKEENNKNCVIYDVVILSKMLPPFIFSNRVPTVFVHG